GGAQCAAARCATTSDDAVAAGRTHAGRVHAALRLGRCATAGTKAGTSAGADAGTPTGTATSAPGSRGAAGRIHTAVPVAEWCGGSCTEHAIALLDARVRAAADPRTGTAAVSVRAGELGSCHGRAACARCTACGGSGADRRSAGHAAVAGGAPR